MRQAVSGINLSYQAIAGRCYFYGGYDPAPAATPTVVTVTASTGSDYCQIAKLRSCGLGFDEAFRDVDGEDPAHPKSTKKSEEHQTCALGEMLNLFGDHYGGGVTNEHDHDVNQYYSHRLPSSSTLRASIWFFRGRRQNSCRRSWATKSPAIPAQLRPESDPGVDRRGEASTQ
jgi:hypothetical protein